MVIWLYGGYQNTSNIECFICPTVGYPIINILYFLTEKSIALAMLARGPSARA